ncbi:uncharacterized protein N7483_007351 [Penicillium malachiteum]|uniref:uncharacterized protein n=1 Tax=Penicillium malachiteum TaxID=1324776 RepID=UPI0025481287|nr:uncharacterized protein N7483_007351 [Penicillium malachiteum]KAJ5725994.1 hypothetical protein N7483_007351 [Penicillium malachiteum]
MESEGAGAGVAEAAGGAEEEESVVVAVAGAAVLGGEAVSFEVPGISPEINNGPARIKVPIFFKALSNAHGGISSEVVGKIPEKPLILWKGSTRAPNTRNFRDIITRWGQCDSFSAFTQLSLFPTQAVVGENLVEGETRLPRSGFLILVKICDQPIVETHLITEFQVKLVIQHAHLQWGCGVCLIHHWSGGQLQRPSHGDKGERPAYQRWKKGCQRAGRMVDVLVCVRYHGPNTVRNGVRCGRIWVQPKSFGSRGTDKNLTAESTVALEYLQAFVLEVTHHPAPDGVLPFKKGSPMGILWRCIRYWFNLLLLRFSHDERGIESYILINTRPKLEELGASFRFCEGGIGEDPPGQIASLAR